MNKFLIIEMRDLSFIRQIETDLTEDEVNSMDRDDKETIFNLDEFEDIWTHETLAKRLSDLLELIEKEKDKFSTEDTILKEDFEDEE